jgi:Xaa-Pro aminopeptidase
VLAAAAASPYDALAGALARLGVGPGPVGLDAAGLGHGEWLATGERLAGTRLVPAEAVLAAARRVKSPYELECLGRALRVVEEALDAVIQSLERGTTEREAATQYAAEAVKRGAAQCLASVLFGERTWMGIAPPSDRALRPGDLVRLDVGALHKGYWASVARTAVLGEPASSIGSAYLALQAALGAATAALRAGAATRSVLESAAAAVREHGAAAGEWVCAGHGIGLAAREAPDLDGAVGALEAGEVLCVELAGREIGSRGLGIRNTALVTTAGGRSLNHSRDDMVALD